MKSTHSRRLKKLFNHLLDPKIANGEDYWDITKKHNLMGISITNNETRFS